MICNLPFRVHPNDDQIIFDNGQVFHRDEIRSIFGEWIDSIVDFGLSLHRNNLDISSLACMAALTLVTSKSSQFTILTIVTSKSSYFTNFSKCTILLSLAYLAAL